MAADASIHLTCASCLAKNRLPAARSGDHPTCGRCKSGLLPDHPVDLTDANFAAVIEGTELPVVVDFWAPWCGPCRVMAPQLEAASRASAGRALFAKVDTDAQRATAARYAIRSIPTLVVLRNGRELVRRSGAMSKATIEQLLATLPT